MLYINTSFLQRISKAQKGKKSKVIESWNEGKHDNNYTCKRKQQASSAEMAQYIHTIL